MVRRRRLKSHSRRRFSAAIEELSGKRNRLNGFLWVRVRKHRAKAAV
jgi:hypothetical protein